LLWGRGRSRTRRQTRKPYTGFNLLKSHRPRRGTTADFRLGARREKWSLSLGGLGEPLAMRAAARLNLPALRRPPPKAYTGLRAFALKWPPDHNAGCGFFSRARGRREQRSFLGGQGPPATGGPPLPPDSFRRNLAFPPQETASTGRRLKDCTSEMSWARDPPIRAVSLGSVGSRTG
jgi:hypothetical protein